MIPKVIHYCWFGGKPLSEESKNCIRSWEKFLPNYEIKKWDESNFDFSTCRYVQEAYESKKWAFVSDFARFWILYNHGGIYFDTDLELIKPIDDLISDGPFFACERHLYEKKELSELTKIVINNHNISDSTSELGLAANAGLGLAANAGLGLYKEILDDYIQSKFITDYSVHDMTTVVQRVTKILVRHGFNPFLYEIQKVNSITIYPDDFFGGCDNITRKLNIRNNTRAIHYYSGTWTTKEAKIATALKKKFSDKGKIPSLFGKTFALPFLILDKSRSYGFLNYLRYYFSKKKNNS